MAKYDKASTLKWLDDNGYKYDKVEHEAVFTMEEMEKAGITAKGDVVKNLFLRNAKGDKHYLVCVPEDKKVDLTKLAMCLASTKLSFGSPERLEKYLGVTQGSVSPISILNDENHEVLVAFDQSLMGKERIGFHPCENTATCFLPFKDIKKIIEDNGNKFMCIKI